MKAKSVHRLLSAACIVCKSVNRLFREVFRSRAIAEHSWSQTQRNTFKKDEYKSVNRFFGGVAAPSCCRACVKPNKTKHLRENWRFELSVWWGFAPEPLPSIHGAKHNIFQKDEYKEVNRFFGGVAAPSHCRAFVEPNTSTVKGSHFYTWKREAFFLVVLRHRAIAEHSWSQTQRNTFQKDEYKGVNRFFGGVAAPNHCRAFVEPNTSTVKGSHFYTWILKAFQSSRKLFFVKTTYQAINWDTRELFRHSHPHPFQDAP